MVVVAYGALERAIGIVLFISEILVEILVVCALERAVGELHEHDKTFLLSEVAILLASLHHALTLYAHVLVNLSTLHARILASRRHVHKFIKPVGVLFVALAVLGEIIVQELVALKRSLQFGSIDQLDDRRTLSCRSSKHRERSHSYAQR